MEQFAQWFIEIFRKIVNNIWKGLVSFGKLIYERTVGDIIGYYKDFMEASKTFTPLDWVFSVLGVLFLAMLFLAIIFFIIILIRRYIRFVKTEKDKETLLHQVALLNYELTQVQDEKNAILALGSHEETSNNLTPKKSGRNQVKAGILGNRFPLLAKVDESYRFNILQTPMKDENKLLLDQLTERFINFCASQLNLFYTPKVARTFFAGMATSKLMILEGISGTGKTSLAYAAGKFFENDSALISVQPSWRDRSEMIGYFNEFTKKYNETDFLKAVYETTYRTDINFVVLDEMNLARVEYYFADFLSLLEMPNPKEWQIGIITDQIPEDPVHFEQGKLLIPENVWFLGTANRDDSTFGITDKVYDRAISIELNEKANMIEAPATKGVKMSFSYLNTLFKEALKTHEFSAENARKLGDLDNYIIDKFRIAFGNRILKQIHTFIPVYIALGGEELEALDYMVSRKIIRKFETLNLPFMQKELEELVAFIESLFGEHTFSETKAQIQSYIKEF